MTGHFPVSSAQARTWFLERWLPGTSQYHIGQAWRLEGELSLPALTAALQALIARHESLRTGFEEEGGEPRQCIVETLSYAPRWVDLSSVPAAEQEERLTAELTGAFEAPFDLARPPLLRLIVWQLDPERQVMLLVLHHIVSDGWSRGILRRELGVLYARALRGESLLLPPLPLQYADYALLQRELMTGEAYRKSLARWKARLSGLEPLELPTDHSRTAEMDYTGGLVEFTVAPGLVTALKALAREQGATLYMVLLAAMQVLLMRLTHQRDIAVGSPVAGRGRSELEGLVGFFVNTLVMRTTLDPDESFTGLLARVREGALEAYGQAEVPFEELVRVLNPVRDASRHPLFQVMLALQNLPPAELRLTGLVVRDMKVPRTTTKFDLGMNLIEREGALEGMLEYASALFDATTMQRWAGHFLTLLSSVVDAPETPVGRLPVLTEAERARQWSWNEAATGEPVAHTLHGMFEAQVRAVPEAISVVGEGGELTYAALDARAEAVARGLRGLGVELGARVGVCLPRSIDLVVGVLGILKAGGAYVPLDPAYPPARLAYMVEDAGLALVLVDEPAQSPVLSEGVRCVEVATLESGPGPQHWPRGSARDLAYVIYTSGSTGNPKGVLINHGAVCTHLQWLRKQFSFGPADRLLMRASTSFDASVWELFSALHSGSTLVLARSASDRDPEAVAKDIREHAATAFIAVPAMLRALLAENHLSRCSSLRIVFAGGEALAASTVNDFHAQCPAELHNLYGPTEDSIWATWWPCPRENVESVPIGRPIPPVETWVMDGQGELLPEGIAGELYLGGAGLAEGYLNRPELTAEKFVAHPFKPGARLYRTGDRVRWRPDGTLEFLGRIDAQVKLRGYRIEPGEIEAALLAEGAAQAAVILREDRAGDPRLVAYVAGVSVEGNALREAMRRRLPEFMVPSAVVVLSELPRTPHGKLDRKALPAPRPLAGGGSRCAPETETERALAELWSDILGIEQISRDDDFFTLGGHSLLLLRLRARVNAHFACSLSMRQLFSCALLKQQAVLVEAQENSAPGAPGAGVSSAGPVLQARERSAFRRDSRMQPSQLPAPDRTPAELAARVELEYPASFAQERMWMRAQVRTGGAPSTVNLASVMEQLVAVPLRPLGDYTLVSPAARLREEGSPPPPARPEYPGVLTRILRQIVEHPQSIAIEQGDVRHTYADLANRVARLLALMQIAGVDRRDILALQLPRSPDLAAAFLATLCAGAVAMPVELEAPAARMKSMLGHARWRLTAGPLADDWTLECLQTGEILKSSTLPEGDLPPLSDPFEPNDPAYVFFTSGSTGEPKAILGRYAGLSQFIAWQTGTLGIGAGERVSGLTVPTFDASLREIFLPLTTGGTLCLPPSGLPLDEEARWLAESHITVLHLVPLRLRAWLSADGLAPLPNLKFAIFSGEPLQGELVETLRASLSETSRIINFYGPTETTLIKTWFEVPKPALNGIQPIGVPIRDAEIEIRDQEGRACGEGEAGEIVIRTPFASLGYLGEASDAWRFRKISSEAGVEEVEYRTGDLGYRDARGVLHILGRLDRQVKISGVRIEPEGIESLLTGHPAIRACAVVPAPAPGGQDTSLIAWVVPVAEMPETAVLRHYLSEWLSPAAIPSLFAPLEALPALRNGKIDRAALSARQPDVRSNPGARRTPPDDPLECALAAIWKSLMPQLEPCREDDFFAVGGNSLMGVRLINRLHSEHDLEIDLRDLLAHPSLYAMADLMRARASQQASVLPA